MTRPRHGAWRSPSSGPLVALGALVAGLVLSPATATAHPFGEPQSVRLAAEANRVMVTWVAPPDDVVALGGALGVLPNRREIVIEPDGTSDSVDIADTERVSGSPEVTAYIEEHIAVRQGGKSCRPDVAVGDLANDGAQVTFTCPQQVRTVDVEISLLTDLHPAYRTAALAEGAAPPERALYTADDTIHTWNFSTSTVSQRGDGSGSLVWVALGLTGAAALILAGVIGIRRTEPP